MNDNQKQLITKETIIDYFLLLYSNNLPSLTNDLKKPKIHA